jgi:topoisomerase-4 subunit A
LPSARSQGEPLTGRLNPPPGSLFLYLLAGNPDDWILLASSAGYGFRVQIKELAGKNKAGKALITLPDKSTVVRPAPINQESDLLAVATLQGRLLIFPVMELPELAKGKGNKIIQVPTKDLVTGKDKVVAMAAFPVDGQLVVLSGKRQLTLRANDIAHYFGNRANRGLYLPKGLQKVDRLLMG